MNNHYVEDKSAYLDIANHPDVKEFINECEYIREPSENEIEEITGVNIESIGSTDMS